MDIENLADRLDFAMREAGFKKQTELAEVAGVPQPTISRILKGEIRRGPTAEIVKKLAGACRVSMNWLLTGEGAAGDVSEPSVASMALMYVTADEVAILTAYRLASDLDRRLLLRTARSLHRARQVPVPPDVR